MHTSPFRFPSFARTTLLMFFGVWAVLLLARLAILALVAPELWNSLLAPSIQDVAKALYIGVKFDGRIAVFLTIPLALALFVPWVEKRLAGWRYVLDVLYAAIFAVVILVYIVDFGYFFYLNQRIDATLFDFIKDADISRDMVMQTYPVIPISLGFAAVLCLAVWLFDRLLRRHIALVREERILPENLWRLEGETNWRQRGVWGFVLTLCLFVVGYGQISSNFFPLRWSNAYFSTNRDLVLLGLNPVQNLYDTVRSQMVVRPDAAAVRTVYDEMAAWLRVDKPDAASLNFWRTVPATPQERPRNVVIIIMESLSWPMTSFAPGDDDPTPKTREIAAGGLYFSNYYASARTTARAVFSLMTNIPDVNRVGGTTSRNPSLVRQYLPLSDFNGYSKYYMIGGSASWANIRGVLTHNIPDLALLEESYWKSPNVDVWGISDLSLFRESIGVLGASRKPFFAIIQTAGFHRPYTIPDDNAGFSPRTPSDETLKNYGFADEKEYNSLRFSDHALGEFFRLASSQPWFKDTVFAIIGDHGLYNTSLNVSGGYLACALQGFHVPLILYAPGFIEPGQKELPAGHADLFPTLAALVGVPMRAHGMGRDILAPDAEKDARQFIAGDSELFRTLVEDNYCYIRKNTEGLYRLDDLEGRNLISAEPARAARMRRFAEGYYQTAKYLLFNNHDQLPRP